MPVGMRRLGVGDARLALSRLPWRRWRIATKTDDGLVTIAPSILAANYASLGDALASIERAGAASVHIDIMDGHFVPNISFGAQLVQDLRALSSLFFDVHLMIDPYESYLESFAQAGADGITVHAEASGDVARALATIRSWGLRAGIAINPKTPVTDQWKGMVEQIIVMTVEPGFGGQKLIDETVKKFSQLREIYGESVSLVADGGVTVDNAMRLCKAGANVLVAGTAFFDAEDQVAFVRQLQGEHRNG